jgi:DNA-binding CsgD family transcriptional regulator
LEGVHRQRLEERAAELAEHYAFSSDTGDLAKAVHFGELAAKRATEVFAYGEAAGYLERALVVQDLVDSGDVRKQCDLLLALGEALFPAGDTERVIDELAPTALVLAERLGDRGRAFRACRLAIDCLDAQGATTSIFRPEYRRWAEQADHYADGNSIERVHADLALAMAWSAQGRLQEAHSLQIGALARARELDDSEALFKSAFYLTYSGAPQYWDERLRLAAEAPNWSRRGVSGRGQAVVLWYSGVVHFAQGERARAEELWRQLEELAERTHVVTATLFVLERNVILSIVDGRLEEAVAQLPRFMEVADELGASLRGRQFGLALLFGPTIYLGLADAWLTALRQFDVVAGPFSQTPGSWFSTARAVCLAHLGRVDEARAIIGEQLDQASCVEDGETMAVRTERLWEGHMGGHVLLLQVAVALEHRGAAQALSKRLASVSHLSNGGHLWWSCLGRHLGDAAALVGDRAAALTFYAQALEAGGKILFRPELALTHVSLAELLLLDGDEIARSEALEHLEIAIPELRDMKMQPALERALAVKDKFEAAAAQIPGRQSASDTLTAREREIASLMADGSSNRDIAEKLVISEGTVDVHVKHILGKLGFRSRAQVAGWFARQGPG